MYRHLFSQAVTIVALLYVVYNFFKHLVEKLNWIVSYNNLMEGKEKENKQTIFLDNGI